MCVYIHKIHVYVYIYIYFYIQYIFIYLSKLGMVCIYTYVWLYYIILYIYIIICDINIIYTCMYKCSLYIVYLIVHVSHAWFDRCSPRVSYDVWHQFRIRKQNVKSSPSFRQTFSVRTPKRLLPRTWIWGPYHSCWIIYIYMHTHTPVISQIAFWKTPFPGQPSVRTRVCRNWCKRWWQAAQGRSK